MAQVHEFPHADKKSFIITRNERLNEGNIVFYSGELKDLISKLKSEHGRNIFIDGGAQVVNELLKENLIDEFIISIIPILLGNGTQLFKSERPEQKSWNLCQQNIFKKG